MSETFLPIAARPSPRRTEGVVPWLRHNLFGNWASGVAAVLLVLLLAWWRHRRRSDCARD